MTHILERSRHVVEVTALLKGFPVVALLGARQVGKTTLAREIMRRRRGPTTLFDLESPEDLARLTDPLTTFRGLRGLIVIDEVQRAPELFPVLRVLADARDKARRFLVLGSAAPQLLRQSSESLAGRIAYHELSGFDLEEVGAQRLERLWMRGGFPKSFLARTEPQGTRWREEFIRTFLERDLPQLGLRIPPVALRRFWTMIAHYHAQTWNSSELARAFGVAHTTVQHYLDILTETFMVRQLPPWHENLSKRQVRAPKIYIRDTGLLHSLLGVPAMHDLQSHPKIGASWEGFAIDAILHRLGARPGEAYFWATHAGAELDLLVVRGRKRLGFEIKRTSAPAITPSMRAAITDLDLDQLDVIHAGETTFPLGPRIRAVPLERVLVDIKPLR